MESKNYELITLPTYRNEAPEERQLISRNINLEGELTRLATEEINYLAYIDFPVGKEIRGNHYHEKKDEYLYIAKGKVKGYFGVKCGENITVQEVIIEEGTLVHMLPGCIHAFVTLEEGHGIEFSPTKYKDIEADIIPVKII